MVGTPRRRHAPSCKLVYCCVDCHCLLPETRVEPRVSRCVLMCRVCARRELAANGGTDEARGTKVESKDGKMRANDMQMTSESIAACRTLMAALAA